MFKTFLKDTKANVAIMTGMALMPMMLAIGVGIDSAELYRARIAFQASVDAAVLGAAKTLAGTGNETFASQYGREIFDANIANLRSSTGNITFNLDQAGANIDCTADGVIANATLRHPLFFGGLHKIFTDDGDPNFANIAADAKVQCGGDTVEIALVLDNSGSMGDDNKLGALQSASRNMINALHTSIGQQSRPRPVQFSIVPFAGMVNVGSNNENANWMDKEGRASYHHEHFDWDADPNVNKVGGVYKTLSGQTVSRFKLYDNLGIDWKGCVEQRPWPYHTTDETPSISNPDSLVVPSFAPDEPDDYSGQYEKELVSQNTSSSDIYCRKWKTNNPTKCHRWHDPTAYRTNAGMGDLKNKFWYNGKRYGYLKNLTWKNNFHPTQGYANRFGGDYDASGDYIGGSTITVLQTGDEIDEDRYLNNYLADEHNRPAALVALKHKYDPDHTGKEDDQYKRQRWTWKYFNNPNPRDVNNNTSGLPVAAGLTGGPNLYCTIEPISPLTDNRTTSINKINAMTAEGATNVPMGIAWGWRTLSSATPFVRGRDESVADNKKIMVIMTDGNNTYYPYQQFSDDPITKNPGFYSTFGYNGGEYETPLPKRLFAGFTDIANPEDDNDTYQQVMDSHMITTCNNAKDAGIQIYTIAFDVPAGSTVKAKLESCSSRGKGGNPLYYSADNNAELIQAFKDITEKISELSIKF